VDYLAGAIEVVLATAEVGDAVPAIGAREVENVGIASFVPGHIFWCDQGFTKSECFAED
jgi:hypothetical protein